MLVRHRDAWEWSHICETGDGRVTGRILGVAPAGWRDSGGRPASLLAAFDGMARLSACLGLAPSRRRGCWRASGGRGAWHGLGVLYVGLPCVPSSGLRAQHDHGLANAVWLLAVVMAVDTGAFAAGRLIGGRRLAPRSAQTRLAGLGGGVVAAMLIGVDSGFLAWTAWGAPLVLVSAIMALSSRGEFWRNRLQAPVFGVKGQQPVIPGHGGVLDRMDGLLRSRWLLSMAEQFFGGLWHGRDKGSIFRQSRALVALPFGSTGSVGCTPSI